MTQFKFELCYLAAQFAFYIKVNRRIKIGIAITSSGAIAAWTQWANCAFLWGFIIAVGQVISAINEILPYQRRIKELSEMQPELNTVYIKVERKWFSVANGDLTESEINDLCYNQMSEWDEINEKFFISDALPQKSDLLQYAEEEKNKYFSQRFGG